MTLFRNFDILVWAKAIWFEFYLLVTNMFGMLTKLWQPNSVDVMSGQESFTEYSFVTKTIIKATFPSYNHWMVLQGLVWCILLCCQEHQMGIDEADHECIFPRECLYPGTIWRYWGSKMWHTRQLLAWYITCINIEGILRGEQQTDRTRHQSVVPQLCLIVESKDLSRPALIKYVESVRNTPNDWFLVKFSQLGTTLWVVKRDY